MSKDENLSSPLTYASFKANRIQITSFRHLLPPNFLGSNNKRFSAPASLKLQWKNYCVESEIPAYQPPKSSPRDFLDHGLSRDYSFKAVAPKLVIQ